MRNIRNRWLLVIGLALAVASPLHARGPKPYPTDFGTASALLAAGNQVSVSYYGWEQTTYFGHKIFALTVSQYIADRDMGCFAFYEVYRTGCQGDDNSDLGALDGMALFDKPATPDNPHELDKPLDVAPDPFLISPESVTFSWNPGDEIVFALMVFQGDGDSADPDTAGPQYNWFFSGDPSRNPDHYAHLGFFSPLLFPDGVPGNEGLGLVPNTAGKFLFGFEDVYYNESDWDFNNSIFSVDGESINPPATQVTPEPATLTLLATGLAGVGAYRRRRRRSGPAPG